MSDHCAAMVCVHNDDVISRREKLIILAGPRPMVIRNANLPQPAENQS